MPKPDAEQWQAEIGALVESVKKTRPLGSIEVLESKETFLPMPEWAIGTTPGLLCLGAQLPTKDGRRTGNAHIIDREVPPRGVLGPIYTVLTDAGSTIRMTEGEIYEGFHKPRWISDVDDVRRRFQQ